MFVTAMIGSGPTRLFTDYLVDATSLATYTFLNVDVGPESPDRIIGITLGANAPDEGADLLTVTIGGNLATIHAYDKGTRAALNLNVMSAVASGALGAGTTTTVVCTFDPDSFLQIAGCAIGVYAMYGLSSGTPFSANANGNNADNNVSTTINIPAGGLQLVSAMALAVGTPTITLTGVTTDHQQTVVGNRWHTIGSNETMSAETARAIAQTGPDSSPSSIAAASWS